MLALVKGNSPAGKVGIANAYRVAPSANLAYFEGVGTGLSPAPIVIVGNPGALTSPLIVTCTTPGPLGTCVLDVGGLGVTPSSTPNTATKLALGADSSLVAFFGQLVSGLTNVPYDSSNTWTFNFGTYPASVAPCFATGLAPQEISEPATLTDSVLARVHTMGLAIDVTFPAQPWDGMQVALLDADGEALAYPISPTSPGGGTTIENPYSKGTVTACKIVIPGQCVTWAFDAVANMWRVISDSASGELPIVAVSAGATVNLTGRALVEVATTSGAGGTINMPNPLAATPQVVQDGLRIRVKDVGYNASSGHPITINPTGSGVQIEPAFTGGGLGGTAVLEVTGSSAEWVWSSTGQCWYLTSYLTHT